jgi:serine/threonine-protein kinase
MSTVFLARKSGAHGFQRLVALKRLHDHLRDDPDLVRMFVDEARLAARIHHLHVVPIVEIGEDASGLYVVMDYVEGGSVADLALGARRAKQALPVGVALRIVLDALSGLTAAHALTDDFGTALNLVHRDVSPQNILVGVDGRARLTDFGIARASPHVYEGKKVTGKLGYMAPEQLSKKALDPRADIFAMGIVLWELLAGRFLFHADEDAESINRLLYRPIPRLAQVAPMVPAELDAICNRALQRAAEDRFPGAAEFLDALDAAGGATNHRNVGAAVESLLGDSLRDARRILSAAPRAPPASSTWHRIAAALPFKRRSRKTGKAP